MNERVAHDSYGYFCTCGNDGGHLSTCAIWKPLPPDSLDQPLSRADFLAAMETIGAALRVDLTQALAISRDRWRAKAPPEKGTSGVSVPNASEQSRGEPKP